VRGKGGEGEETGSYDFDVPPTRPRHGVAEAIFRLWWLDAAVVFFG
jgi:hypothetical protein